MDEAYALAALKAGVTFEYEEARERWGAWTLAGDVVWMDDYSGNPLRDYAAAARALGLKPDVVAIDRDVAVKAESYARTFAARANTDVAQMSAICVADAILSALGGEPL